MSGTDDYILITSSQNSDDDTSGSDDVVFEKGLDDASLVTMQKQGIFLEKEEEILPRPRQLEEFSKEIFEQSGIEILNPEGKEEEKDF